MPPAMLMFVVGGVWIPFPLFLLWPFIGLAWLALTCGELFVRNGQNAGQGIAVGKHALAVFCRLSGLRIDVESKDGSGVNIRII